MTVAANVDEDAAASPGNEAKHDFITKEQLRAEIRQDLEVTNKYIAEHGSFAEMVRQHYCDEA